MTTLSPPIAPRALAGERLAREDGLALFATRDLLGLGWLANAARERLHGAKTFFNINRHINYTNVCVNHCRFCAFSRAKGDPGAWEYSLDEIFAMATRDLPPGGAELHIVGGCHPDLGLEFFEAMLCGLKERLPHGPPQGLHRRRDRAHRAPRRLTPAETLARLKAAGLGSLPGGGAEVLAPEVRRLICEEKISAAEWLEIHRAAHGLGLKSNCTLLYGHVESDADRVEHLLALRALQDETGGFQAFVPLAFQPQGNDLGGLPGPTGATDLKVIAASRLLLDNIPHIKAYWVMLGVKTAQIALHFGADDLDGTVVEETISHMAGAGSPQALGVREIRRLIEEAGRVPVLRDTVYREL